MAFSLAGLLSRSIALIICSFGVIVSNNDPITQLRSPDPLSPSALGKLGAGVGVEQ